MCHTAVTGCEITEYIVRHVQELNPGADDPGEVTQLDGTACQCPFLPWMAFEGNLRAIMTSALGLSSPGPNSLPVRVNWIRRAHEIFLKIDNLVII